MPSVKIHICIMFTILKIETQHSWRFLFYFVFLQGYSRNKFVPVYTGPLKQYKVTKLSPSTGYKFRLAAVNDKGKRFVFLYIFFIHLITVHKFLFFFVNVKLQSLM